MGLSGSRITARSTTSRKIRQELDALGYPFRSRSDTEVIVNGWHAWGPKIFTRLRGMFALAIWDRRSQSLILARDRLGKKPLYYAATTTALLFGSEIKALLTWPGVPRTADPSAIDRYLTLGYVPAPGYRLCRDFASFPRLTTSSSRRARTKTSAHRNWSVIGASRSRVRPAATGVPRT